MKSRTIVTMSKNKKNMKMILYLYLFCAILFSSCDKTEDTSNGDISKGIIVGYLQCSDSEMENTLFGFYIIANNKDSLLSFNVNPSIFDLDISKLDYGVHLLIGDSISFNYRNAEIDEIKQFNCPPTHANEPGFYPMEKFSQVIITNISIIQYQ